MTCFADGDSRVYRTSYANICDRLGMQRCIAKLTSSTSQLKVETSSSPTSAVSARNLVQLYAAAAGRREELTGRQVSIPGSFSNHACDPTCEVQQSARGQPFTVTARRNISAGEELSISYIDTCLPRSARQALTKQLYSFTCTCTR
jgi:hypothetical protein